MSKDTIVKILMILVIIFLIIFIIYTWRKISRIKKGTSVFSNITSTSSVSISPIKEICAVRPDFNYTQLITADTSNSVQTAFFKESADYALKIVKGEEPICADNLSESSVSVLNALKCMNEGERSNVYIGIQYMLISTNDLEESMRQKSAEKEMPMWILIIQEAMIKTMPNFNLSASPLSVSYCKTA